MTSPTATPATFKVTAQPSGRSFDVEPGEAILAAAIRQGVGMPYGCKDGACGSCKCKKLEGTVVHGVHQTKALSPEEAEQGYILTCCGVPQSDVVIYSKQVTDESAFPIRKMPSRVLSMERRSHDVVVLRMQLPANDTMRYHAGQYVEFILRDGARRSYSMATAPHRLMQETGPGTSAPVIELHIRHMPGGKFTDHVFTAMKEKEILRVEGPYGSFYLREDSDKPIVFLASGTGFAPIKAVIEHLQFKGSRREATLYWGGRRPADLYLDEWVKAQLAQMPNLKYVPVISNALPEDNWTGRTGFVHKAVMEDFPDLSGHQVYACGAPIVVDSAREQYTALCKLPPDEFYADAFTSEAEKHGATA
jgi:CDP-4-dehydro-6-deoxyglucose reductase